MTEPNITEWNGATPAPTENKEEWTPAQNMTVHDFTAEPELIGTFMTSFTGMYGKNFVVEKDNQENVIVRGKTVLISQLRNIKPLQRIKIVCNGKRTGKAGRPYIDFKVWVANKPL